MDTVLSVDSREPSPDLRYRLQRSRTTAFDPFNPTSSVLTSSSAVPRIKCPRPKPRIGQPRMNLHDQIGKPPDPVSTFPLPINPCHQLVNFICTRDSLPSPEAMAKPPLPWSLSTSDLQVSAGSCCLCLESAEEPGQGERNGIRSDDQIPRHGRAHRLSGKVGL